MDVGPVAGPSDNSARTEIQHKIADLRSELSRMENPFEFNAVHDWTEEKNLCALTGESGSSARSSLLELRAHQSLLASPPCGFPVRINSGRRKSRPRNLPIPHSIACADWPVFPGFFGL
jgi:hypothetical protein